MTDIEYLKRYLPKDKLEAGLKEFKKKASLFNILLVMSISMMLIF